MYTFFFFSLQKRKESGPLGTRVVDCLLERDYKQWNVFNLLVYCYT